MPAIQGRTREQLRQHIGRTLGAAYVSTTKSTGGSTSTLLDESLVLGGADTQIGKWIRFTSGNNGGNTRRVTDSSIASNISTLTFMPIVGTATAGETYELWEGAYNPDDIDDFINQSIMFATGWVYDPIENIELHGDGKQTRFDIPSNISMISKMEYRHKISSKRIHACDVTFDETLDNEMSQEVDSKDFKRGSSLKITTSAGDGSFITDSIASLNISGYTHLEGWVKATSAIAAADFNICLDDATCTCDGNDKETLAVPAASADTWTFFRIALANPESDTAIVSVGIEYNANSKTNTVRCEDLRVVHNDTAEWTTLDRRNWKIDKEARGLVLLRDGHQAIGYALIKITGGDKPALLTADSTATEIDEDYIIANTVSLALLSSSGGPATDPDSKRQLSAFWTDQAQRARRAFPMLVNIRSVD